MGLKVKGFSILQGSIWIAASRISSQVAQLALIVIAARFLSPAEFGVFAFVSVIAMLLMRVAEAGCGDFITSWHGADEAVSAAFAAAIGTGLFLCALGLAAAALIPGLSVTVSTLTTLFSLWMPLAVLTPAQGALLIRKGRLGTLSVVQIASELVGLAVAVAGLKLGQGVYALAYARITTQLVQIVCFLAITRYIPVRVPTLRAMAPMLRYCRSVGASRVFSTLRGSIFPLVIGGFLGPAAVGLYRAADRLTGAVAELIGEPASMVGWVLFRRATGLAKVEGRDPREAVRELASSYLPLLFAVSAPVFLLVAIFSAEGVAVLLGEEWRAAGPIISVLALARFLLMPAGLTLVTLSYTDGVRWLPMVSLFNCAVAITFAAIAAPFGVMAAAGGEVLAGAIGLATSVYLHRKAGVDWWAVLSGSAVIAPALAVCGTVALAIHALGVPKGVPEIVPALGAALCGLAAYSVTYLLLRPHGWSRIVALQTEAAKPAVTL